MPLEGIRLENVTVDFGSHTALNDISIHLAKHSTAIIGANGSGKSTFARLLNGLVKPTQGTVTVNGSVPSTRDAGFLFSNPDLQIVMPTVAEDVAFSLSGSKLTNQQVSNRVSKALISVGLENLADANCYELSSGQKQLLAIAAILVREQRLLIADEPTTLLDLPNTKSVTTLLHSLELDQLVIATHDLDLAATCDEVVWIHQSQVRMSGKPKQVIGEYRNFFN